MLTGGGALRQGVDKHERAVRGTGFHAGHRNAVDEEVNHGSGSNAAVHQNETEVVNQRTADVHRLSSGQHRGCLCDVKLGSGKDNKG